MQQTPSASLTQTPGALSPIAVIGMHRSGTSCLIGLLADAGVWLGAVSKHDPFNRKGNQEWLAVSGLHDQVLADNGARWDAPPAGDCIWQPARIAELSAILAEYPTDHRWAVKDPRACFTIGGWLAERPDLCLIGTFRHPAAVAASLRRRGPGLQVDDEIDLWCRYNSQLLRLHERLDFPLVCFDLPPERYLAQVTAAFATLGLALAPSRAYFFEAGLRTARGSGLVSAQALTIYDRLRTLAC